MTLGTRLDHRSEKSPVNLSELNDPRQRFDHGYVTAAVAGEDEPGKTLVVTRRKVACPCAIELRFQYCAEDEIRASSLASAWESYTLPGR
jgi:hypothetical protein